MSSVARPKNKREIILRVVDRQKGVEQAILLDVGSLSQLCWRLGVDRQADLREITQVGVARQVVIDLVTLLDAVDQLVTVRDAKTIR